MTDDGVVLLCCRKERTDAEDDSKGPRGDRSGRDGRYRDPRLRRLHELRHQTLSIRQPAPHLLVLRSRRHVMYPSKLGIFSHIYNHQSTLVAPSLK